MSSWITCSCGNLLHKNMFCGANVCVVVEDTLLDGISESASNKDAAGRIVLAGDTLVRCRRCGRIAIEEKKTGTITIYTIDVSPESKV